MENIKPDADSHFFPTGGSNKVRSSGFFRAKAIIFLLYGWVRGVAGKNTATLIRICDLFPLRKFRGVAGKKIKGGPRRHRFAIRDVSPLRQFRDSFTNKPIKKLLLNIEQQF